MRRSIVVVVVAALLSTAGLLLLPRIGGVARHPLVALRLVAMERDGSLDVPVVGVRKRDLRDSWNGPRSGGRRHKGIDIFARRDTPIRSVTPGIVATVGTNALGGRVVRVFGPGGEWHYYAHLERFAEVRAGDLVEAGTVIGYVGDSGNARGTPSHLHYGIYRLHGSATNPYPRLVRASS
jgi:murein DD-endopeptidase MepM/ murein hydrolase activator NlpD